jgi:hypothetical protein
MTSMRDNYEHDGPGEEWPAVRPPQPDTAFYEDFATRLDQAPAAARDGSLRRLSRLTWRTTQLSAVAAAAFAILFARTAPTQATSSQTSAKAAGSQSSAKATVTPSPASSTPKPTKKATTAGAAATQPPTQAPAAAAPAPQPSSAAAAPPPTLAPPTTPPAPAPAPSAVQSTSSGTHSGG